MCLIVEGLGGQIAEIAMLFGVRGVRRHFKVWGLIVVCVALYSDSGAAAERGLSSYLPGYYGDYLVAVAPRPGLYVYATNYNYRATKTVPGFTGELRLSASALISGFQFVAPEKLWNTTIAVGAYSSLISADLQGRLVGAGGAPTINQHKAAGGDTSLSPISLYWNAGNIYVNAYEAIFLPTGEFRTANALNLSRNYYSFDTVLAVTYLDRQRGLEISLASGLMFNTTNPSTDYLTGTEIHLDAMINTFVSPTLAAGLHGYVYSQLDDDTIRGVRLVGQRSSSMALGPSLLWIPSEIGLDGKLVLKWLHDVDSENRFRGDVLSITGAFKF